MEHSGFGFACFRLNHGAVRQPAVCCCIFFVVFIGYFQTFDFDFSGDGTVHEAQVYGIKWFSDGDGMVSFFCKRKAAFPEQICDRIDYFDGSSLFQKSFCI